LLSLPAQTCHVAIFITEIRFKLAMSSELVNGTALALKQANFETVFA